MIEMEAEKGFTTSKKRAWIVLEDGTVFEGKAFGYPKNVIGEIVFNTGMVGYPQALTDPSYKGQILLFTYPLVGNYGVPSYQVLDSYGIPKFFESDSIKVQGVIVHEHCTTPSHWSSVKSLHEWLYEERIPGVYDVDTRSITKRIRIKGVMMGALVFEESPEEGFRMLKNSKRYEEINFVEEVSTRKPIVYGDGKKTVVLIDYGVKYNIIRNLVSRGFKVIRVPFNYSAESILNFNPDALVLSNGPGDPKQLINSVNEVRKLLNEYEKPVLGICLGNQVLGLAFGANTYKLKFGHRGQNKPIIELSTGRCYIVSENHGYAVSEEELKGTDLEVWFKNIDDGTVEGLKHKWRPIISTQFHPEAFPGPYDTRFVFDIFSEMVSKNAKV